MHPSLALLPNEIIVSYLARIARSYYPTLSTVCKTFHTLLSSTELYEERSRLGCTEQYLYVCMFDYHNHFSEWFMLWVNPNCTRKLLGPIPACNSPSTSTFTEVVGSEIYVMGGPIDRSPSSSVRILDCRNHTWRDAPSMNVSRNNAPTIAYDGKIFVMGERGTTKIAVFDTKTQTWTQSPVMVAQANECILRIVEFEGTVYVQTYCNVHSRFNLYGYDAKQGKWESCGNKSETFPMYSNIVMHLHYAFDYKCYGRYKCMWYDINSGEWKEVKRLDSFQEKHLGNGELYCNRSKLVSFGAKLLFIWEREIKHDSNDRKIWCAEIAIEKRNRDEVWGNVEWVDVVHSGSHRLLNCLAVSV